MTSNNYSQTCRRKQQPQGFRGYKGFRVYRGVGVQGFRVHRGLGV